MISPCLKPIPGSVNFKPLDCNYYPSSQRLIKILSAWLFKSRSNNQRYSIEIGVLKNFTKFTGKHLCQSLFFNRLYRFTQQATPTHTNPHHATTTHTNPHQATHQTTPTHTRPHQTTPIHTMPHQTTPTHTRPHQPTPGYTNPRQTTPTHIRPHQPTPVHTSAHQATHTQFILTHFRPHKPTIT